MLTLYYFMLTLYYFIYVASLVITEKRPVYCVVWNEHLNGIEVNFHIERIK